MPISVDPKQFHLSITKELKALQDRVRSLIGDAHWGEDGRYKEAVLRNVIRRFLTQDAVIGTGFIVRHSPEELKVSNQIDILVVDSRYPLLFAEGDFIITTPFNVLAMIEVKTELEPSDREIFEKATENGRIAGKDIFNGIFSFEGVAQNRIETNSFEDILKNSQGEVNNICFGEDFFVKYWDRSVNNPIKNGYGIYKITGLSFSYFISNLVESVYPNTGVERNWFLYPIEEGKEAHRIKTVMMNDEV